MNNKQLQKKGDGIWRDFIKTDKPRKSKKRGQKNKTPLIN
jgi:hypothetical protein